MYYSFHCHYSLITCSLTKCHLLSVHGIAGPDDNVSRLLDGLDMARQVLVDLISSIARNKCHLADLLVSVQDIQQRYQLIRLHAGSTLDSDRVLDTPEVLNMGAIELTRTISDPQEMCADIVVLLLRRVGGINHLSRQRLLVLQQQTFMRGENVDSRERAQGGCALCTPCIGICANGLHEVQCICETIDNGLVLLAKGRRFDMVQVPVRRMVQVSKSLY